LKTRPSRFRWAQCQIDWLVLQRTRRGIIEALRKLPDGLYATYDRILEKIDSEGEETASIAQRALRWLVGSIHPLRLSQIAEAIKIEPGRHDLNEDYELPADVIIVEVLSSLVQYDPENDSISLSHFSVQVCSMLIQWHFN
jgi:ankyrin repeat domain-containing protein 50